MNSVCYRAIQLGILATGVIPLMSPPLLGDAGFGTIRKKKITLQVRQPALVRLANTSIAFTGRSTNPEYLPVQESLLAILSTELLSNEKTLQVKQNPAEANWVFSMDVTGFHISQPEKRTDNYANKGASTTVRWTGSLNVAYRINDHTGRVHDADNANCAYQKDTDPNAAVSTTRKVLGVPVALPGGRGAKAQNSNEPHNTEDVKQAMIKDVVNSIAARLGNTSRALEVQVATGEARLDRASDFMDKKLWARALEELESGSALPKPEEESYREYDIGLAYEAMAYDPKSSDEQRTNFFKAMEHYDKAMELNPKEKYYVETVARARDAVARYKTLETMQREDRQKQTTPSVASVAVTTSTTPTTPPPPLAKPKLNVAGVAEMVKEGVPEEQIASIIQNSPVDFDPLDKDTAIAVARSHISLSLQNELRKKVGAPLLPVPAPAAAPKATPTKSAVPAKKQP
jgi:tetratricopeptide (TPR) repeat protein